MKKTSIIIALMGVFTLTTPLTIWAAKNPQSQQVEGFDFNYTSETHSGFNLIQVFDDGDMTYFQFADHSDFPSVDIVHENGKRQTVQLEAKTPYLIVRGVANKFALQKDKRTIYVRYNGKRTFQSPVEVTPVINTPAVNAVAKAEPVGIARPPRETIVSTPVAQNVGSTQATQKSADVQTAIKINVPFFENSITVSKKSREDIEESIRQLKGSHRAVIRSRPSSEDNYVLSQARANTIETLLKNAGMQDQNIEKAPQIDVVKGKNPGFYMSEIIMIEGITPKMMSAADLKAAEPPKPRFIVKAGESIAQKLTDYSKRFGYMLVWEAGDYRAGSDIDIDKDYEQTLQSVISSMKVSGINLEPTIFDNNVVRVVEVK